jgi:hypothetical protein
MLEHMLAEHGLMHPRALLGFTDFAPEEHAALPPVLQPLVNTHPRTGVDRSTSRRMWWGWVWRMAACC